MTKEFLSVLAQLEREKGINRDILIEAVQQALTVAAKKVAKLSHQEDEVDVKIDPEKGDIHVYIGSKEVVSNEFGRIVAQTARQVIIQKIREAEKDNIGYAERSRGSYRGEWWINLTVKTVKLLKVVENVQEREVDSQCH